MSKHTPGPWLVVRDMRNDREDGHIRGEYLSGYNVESEAGEIIGCEGIEAWKENAEADARLIAAAPELLTELENIANADPAKWDAEVRDQFREWAQNRARAAIAKATGEQA